MSFGTGSSLYQYTFSLKGATRTVRRVCGTTDFGVTLEDARGVKRRNKYGLDHVCYEDMYPSIEHEGSRNVHHVFMIEDDRDKAVQVMRKYIEKRLDITEKMCNGIIENMNALREPLKVVESPTPMRGHDPLYHYTLMQGRPMVLRTHPILRIENEEDRYYNPDGVKFVVKIPDEDYEEYFRTPGKIYDTHLAPYIYSGMWRAKRRQDVFMLERDDARARDLLLSWLMKRAKSGSKSLDTLLILLNATNGIEDLEERYG